MSRAAAGAGGLYDHEALSGSSSTRTPPGTKESRVGLDLLVPAAERAELEARVHEIERAGLEVRVEQVVFDKRDRWSERPSCIEERRVDVGTGRVPSGVDQQT